MVQRKACVVLMSFALSGCFTLADFDALFGDDTPPPKVQAGKQTVLPKKSGPTARTAPATSKKTFAYPEYRVGDRYTFDNPLETWQIVNVAHDRISWRSDKNEWQVTGLNPLLPALEWSDSAGNTGRRRIRDTLGALFPMRVGAKMTFRSTVTTTRPPYGWENSWGCYVHGKETIEGHDRSFETFQVGCGRKRTDELTFNYVPELGHYLRQRINHGPNKPATVRHLVAFERADGTVIAGVVPASQKLAVAGGKSPPAVKPEVAKRSVQPVKPQKEASPVKKPPTAQKEKPETQARQPVPALPAVQVSRRQAEPPGTPKAVLMQSIEPQTPIFAKLRTVENKATPAETPAAGLPPSSGGVEKPLKQSGAVPPPSTSDALEGSRPRIPVPAFSPDKTVNRVPPPPTNAASAETVRVTHLKQAAGELDKGTLRAKVISAEPEKSFGAHLASYKKIENADRGWKILLKKYNEVLSDLQPVIKRVEINGKGTFYRLYAGSFKTPTEAKDVCKRLAQRGLFCTIS